MGQKTYKVQVHEASQTHSEISAQSFADTVQFASYLRTTIDDLRAEGYLLANVDRVEQSEDDAIAQVYIGHRYTYGDISTFENDRNVISAAGLRKYNWKNSKISDREITNYMKTVGNYLENNGYPFASVGLANVEIVKDKVIGEVSIERGPFVKFDSIHLVGNLDIRRSFLSEYLDIKEGEPYSRKKFEQVRKRLNDLPYVELKSTPKLKFYDGKAEVYIEVDKKKSSRFDFLIGVLPSNVNGEQKFTISGEFTGEMYNKLGSGEYIYASYERLRPDVQELDLKFNYPYIAGLPIGAAADLRVYRKTDEFLEVVSNLGLSYQISGNQSLQFGWNFKSSRLIDIDSAQIVKTKELPKDLDISYQGGMLGYQYEQLDYRWNPSKGFSTMVRATVGQKSVLPNRAIQDLMADEFDFSTIYDTVDLKTFQLEASAQIDYYLPLAEVITLKNSLRGAYLFNDDKVYENEFYRIGGNRNLRGFDEQSIITKGYGLLSTELRLILDRNSYLTLPFIDFGYTEVNVNDTLIWEQVIGLGLGINFASPAGIFNVSFASGGRQGQGIDFSNTKVHFGYVSLF